MKPFDAIDLAMSITQPGHRIRLETTGIERAAIDSYKATIMLTTANNSLHSLLSQDNSQGTAGSMRVFEIKFAVPGVHTKREADDYLRALDKNYGHIGELFMAALMSKLDAVGQRIVDTVRSIDEELDIQSSERFWSATIAVVLVTCEIAREMGIVSWSPAALRRWIVEKQVPAMRGIVISEYSDPLGILSDYLEQISNNIIVIGESQAAVGTNRFVERKPVGALFGHYDRPDNMLYVLKKGFKDYCVRVGANSRGILDDLSTPTDKGRIVPLTNIKRTLGAGTEFGKGQSWCFAINMAHPDVSGAVELKVIEGGGQAEASSAPALHVVQ